MGKIINKWGGTENLIPKQPLENVAVIYPEVLTADGSYAGPLETGTAGAALAFGDLVYQSTSDSRWELVVASTVSSCARTMRICVLVASGDGQPTLLLKPGGKVRADAAFPSMTVHTPVFATTTAGDISHTAPSAAGDIVRIAGFANSADELSFEPSPDWMEIA